MTDIETLLRQSVGVTASCTPPTSATETAPTASAPTTEAGRTAAAEPPLPRLAIPAEIAHVSYCIDESPVGKLLLASTERGLVRLAFLRAEDDDRAPGVHDAESVLQQLADDITPRVVDQRTALDAVRRELDEFFTGRRSAFDLPLDWRLTSGFARRVLRATAAIPYGELSTYKGIATAAGSPKAYRAAGTALGANPLPIIVPCHRVLHSGGGLGGYAGGLARKLRLLTVEGHNWTDTRR